MRRAWCVSSALALCRRPRGGLGAALARGSGATDDVQRRLRVASGCGGRFLAHGRLALWRPFAEAFLQQVGEIDDLRRARRALLARFGLRDFLCLSLLDLLLDPR